jgi:hypothetical protein
MVMDAFGEVLFNDGNKLSRMSRRSFLLLLMLQGEIDQGGTDAAVKFYRLLM